MLPPFTRQGVLPPGDYLLSIDELRDSILVCGPANRGESWDAKWRLTLVNNLGILAKQLWSIGITEIYIDGSFVENKEHPNDIDGYFVCSINDQVNRVIETKLNEIDPYKSWGWDNRLRRVGGHLPLWQRYRIDLWPYSLGTMLGPQLEMSEAFRRTKFKSIIKGIIKLKPPGAMS